MAWPTKRPTKFGPEELASLDGALHTNELWYWKPQNPNGYVNRAVEEIQRYFNVPRTTVTSSGTASIHVALGAAQLEPGSEVITSPITDAGTITPIIYQNCIPVFSDVDLNTSIITREHIEAQITDKTRAVVLVHLAGCPTNIDSISEFCRNKGIILIEDACQALGAKDANGRRLGTTGNFGCFSLNDQKHITCGEGGFVITHSDDDYFLSHNYADKFYDRHKKGVRLNRAALNYRMSELDGAMTLVQLDKLEEVVSKRSIVGDYLSSRLTEIEGVFPQLKEEGGRHSYFYFQLRLDEKLVKKGRDDFVKELQARGIPASGAYVSSPLYKSPMFKNKSFFPGGIWPAELVNKKKYDYEGVILTNTENAIASTISLRLHEGITNEDVDWCVQQFKEVISS
ncbi:DegT/DnrJ/EryC1/StrS aminotransferase family protein [Methylococcaceae bacterium WWC4]|nr:DegT/DnrJ/EryC1/StrS aminotransferase family protein [Methylococcaceae bacterium WWC4]